MDILEDNNFFQRLGLIKKFELKSNCTVDKFRETFQSKVGTDDSFKDVYFSKKEFKGFIKRDSFDIHKSLKFPDSSMSMYGATGTYNENEDRLLINVAVYLPIGTFTLYFSMILFTNIIIVVNLLTQPWTIVLICGFSIIMTSFFYFSFKSGVTKLTRELEEVLTKWTE